MKKTTRWYLTALILLATTSVVSAQVAATKPKIMVIPFTREGEDIRTILDADPDKRLAITKVKEGFDLKGYPTVDFTGKLKAAKDNQAFTSDNQSDIKTKIIELSGCDIYVITEIDIQGDNSGTSIDAVLSAYEVSTGNSLANKVGSSGKFYTADVGKLTTKAVEKCIDEFTQAMDNKLSQTTQIGRSVLVDISFAENATLNMSSEIGSDKLPLSDVLEDWFAKNSLNNAYHIQGTTNLKMIFDDVKIPARDSIGNNYNSNRYALEIFKFLKSLGLAPSKEIKGNTIYITIN
jgi:hypothetical protein